MKLLVIPRPESHTPPHLDPPAVLLEQALELALPAERAPVPPLQSAKSRTLTHRAGLLVGKKCNLRCHFCSYLDRIDDRSHPEYEFLPLEKAKAICKTLVDVFGRSALNLEGGEPTIYPQILPLLAYCRAIGLYPTVVTNALVLDRMERVREFKQAGIRDFAVSIHGLGPVHDAVVGMEGAHVRQMKALRNLAEAGVPFRINVVMTKATILHLPQLATLGVRTGARVVSFNAFSPWEDQVTAGTRTTHNVPRYSEIREPLVEALDILAAADVEANVKYIPLCILPEQYRKSMYNFAQLQYDHHEWDHASFAWIDAPAQRLAAGDIIPPAEDSLRPVQSRTQLRLGLLRQPLERFLPPTSRRGRVLERLEQSAAAALKKGRQRWALEVCDAEEKRFCLDYATAARSVCYQYGDACRDCDVKAICDGLHADYSDLFGQDEILPIKLGSEVTDPTYYIREQDKVVEVEDESWAFP